MAAESDLEPATRQLAGLVRAVSDEQLAGPTPCRDYTVGDLLSHIDDLAMAFTLAAAKDFGDVLDRAPSPDASRLGRDWRERIPRRLDALAQAWRRPAAWEGMTRAGGIDLPGEVAGQVVVDELVLHGWDLARASGQPFDVDPELLRVCGEFVAAMSAPGQEESRQGLFGPVVEVGRDRPELERVLGMAGRDPDWRPA
ncbi:TIGR03086 family protein [Saccharopolyspora erythraea]|uniref:TIGR03086 family metal-binding protein n=1 Tax=Saccharopolyspora erythraea TaxID=1836 RepID=UPI001BA8C2FA|nr:TIGR03086 family metal-binding protein [Saccharopolyspora erythraea]QUH02851.1 TIGR03086 family protein [Saccharopolyspora erythraea]